jgi:hypothetical protein
MKLLSKGDDRRRGRRPGAAPRADVSVARPRCGRLLDRGTGNCQCHSGCQGDSPIKRPGRWLGPHFQRGGDDRRRGRRPGAAPRADVSVARPRCGRLLERGTGNCHSGCQGDSPIKRPGRGLEPHFQLSTFSTFDFITGEPNLRVSALSHASAQALKLLRARQPWFQEIY